MGQLLIDIHLLKIIPKNNNIVLNFTMDSTTSMIEPSYTIKKIGAKDRFKDNTIFLNNDLCIEGISDETWEYTIGG